jgi:hypothetical protein
VVAAPKLFEYFRQAVDDMQERGHLEDGTAPNSWASYLEAVEICRRKKALGEMCWDRGNALRED